MAFSGRAKFPPPYLDIATDRRDAHTSLDRDDRASTKAACDPDEGDVLEGRTTKKIYRILCGVCALWVFIGGIETQIWDRVFKRGGARAFFFIQSWTLGSRSSMVSCDDNHRDISPVGCRPEATMGAGDAARRRRARASPRAADRARRREGGGSISTTRGVERRGNRAMGDGERTRSGVFGVRAILAPRQPYQFNYKVAS